MHLLPAIDLRDGHVVRLTQGDYDRMTVYDSDPVAVARSFAEQGATHVHLVDLDGAKDGALVNDGIIREIVATSGLEAQVGGGIRDEERIQNYLDAGLERVILGTVAAENFDFVEEMVAKYGDHIAVGVDARNGYVAVRGWLKTTSLAAMDFCKRCREACVKTIIYTDIERDGLLSGANLSAYRALSEIEGLQVIASGGVSSFDDLDALASYDLYGAIIGKAMYDGRLHLAEAICHMKGGSA